MKLRLYVFASLFIACLLSCRTSVSSDVANPSPPVDSPRPQPMAPLKLAISSPPENLVEDFVDPLAIVKELWEKGQTKEARIVFQQAASSALRSSLRTDEWTIWRGKLFTQHYSGLDLGFAENSISAILTVDDDVWAGTWTGGLMRLAIPLNTVTTWDPGIPSLAVRTVNRIRNLGRYIAVVRYGALDFFDTKTESWSTETELPVVARLQDILVTPQARYLATLGQGLWRQKNGGQWESLALPGLFITRLEQNTEGHILICTMDQGLYIYDAKNNTWSQPPIGPLRFLNVTSIISDGDTYIFGSYGSGAYIWNIKDDSVHIIDIEKLGDPYVLTVGKHQDWLYFGTFGGGLRAWNRLTGMWDSFSLPHGFSSTDVASFATGKDGVWIGTLGGGLTWIHEKIH